MKKPFKGLFNYFLQGLLYTAPISIIIFLIFKGFEIADNIIPLKTLFDSLKIKIPIPGLGVLLFFLLTAFFGFIGNTMIGRPVIAYLKKLLNKAPLIKDVYTAITDLVSAFVGKKKRFSEPVLVKMGNGLEKLGFITNKDLKELGINEDKIAVYFPFSYGVMGSLFIVSKDNIVTVNAPSSVVMKFIVSGGVINIDKEQKEEKK